MSTRLPLKVVVGPTASGKSSYAVEWAKRIGGEVVNADSRQQYREVSIGVAKPVFDRVDADFGYVDGVAHHLFFELSPNQRANVVAYQRRAFEVIDDILARGRMPILVGGTGYYIQAIVDNMQYADVDIDDEVAVVSRMSHEDTLNELRRRDARAYERIDRANPRRVVNALVRVRLGLTDVRPADPRYNVEMVGMKVSAEELERRIILRVDEMLRAGLLEEVRGIIGVYGYDAPVLDSIGYKEVIACVQGNVSEQDMRELIITHTRQYARKQMQWFKRDERIRWMDVA